MSIVQTVAEHVIDNVAQVIIGKRNEIRLTVLGLLCQGHLLIEDVPGVGKTMLARALARSIGASFSRIQFTPDMLPSDVTGVSVFNQRTHEFEFRPGPIMSQIVLTDEINRATPKTQSALLEAMEERQVTVDGHTYPLDVPFMVLATQNPIEYEGTFPLPEAQLDRFLIRLTVGYPSREEEVEILRQRRARRQDAFDLRSITDVDGNHAGGCALICAQNAGLPSDRTVTVRSGWSAALTDLATLTPPTARSPGWTWTRYSGRPPTNSSTCSSDARDAWSSCAAST